MIGLFAFTFPIAGAIRASKVVNVTGWVTPQEVIVVIPLIATITRVIWVIVEYPYVRRFRIKPRKDWDRHSAKIWDAANLIELPGMILGFIGIGRINTGTSLIGTVGLTLMLAGTTIRWTAIYTLGQFFTGTVLIKDDHRLIRSGLYRHVRHPAYTGALLAHLGLGLAFSNWFSIGLSTAPFLVAAIYRIYVEERALREAFGKEYADYSMTTRRLIPMVY
jgi:protein-S-isoprenylcysteine O-methyltransferase Ste14